MESIADDINTLLNPFDSQKKDYEKLLKEYDENCSTEYKNCIKKAIIARINEYKEGELDLSGFGFDDIKGYETRDVLQEVFKDQAFAPKLAKVKILNLSYNKLYAMPDISAFQSLNTIKLIGNDIDKEELPVVNGKQIENTDIFEFEEEPKQDKRIEAEIKSITLKYLNLKEAAKMQYKKDCIKEIIKRINECSDGELDLSGFGADEFDKDEVGVILNEVFKDPAFADKLAKVKILNLSYNKLEELPDISAFTQLTTLDLSYNEFKNIPVFDGCDKIEELDMSKNDIVEFNEQNASAYKNLKILKLNDNDNINIIAQLPEALEELQIRGLDIYPFDEDFKSNSKLTILDIAVLSDIGIEENNDLFTQLYENGFSKVKILNVSAVSVSAIDADIEHFQNLEYLDISGNDCIKSIHSNILTLPNLKTLIIDQDCVNSLDEDIKNTIELLKERGIKIVDENDKEIEFYEEHEEGEEEEHEYEEEYGEEEENEYGEEYGEEENKRRRLTTEKYSSSENEESSSELNNTSNPVLNTVLGKRPAENQQPDGNNNAKRQKTDDDNPSRLGTMANQTMANQEEEQKNEQKEELKQSEIDALKKQQKEKEKEDALKKQQKEKGKGKGKEDNDNKSGRRR